MTQRSTAPARKDIPRAPLALAITSGLIALLALPSVAASEASPVRSATAAAIEGAFDPGTVPATARPATRLAPLGPAFSTQWRRSLRGAPARAAAAPVASDTPSDSQDAEAWRTDEFQADWGLEVINAHHAYARGLSGAGVRLGALDSGTAFDHPEFAGKDHRSITMANLLADGSRCGSADLLAGPDACFSSEGDQVAINGEYYDPALAVYFPDPANDDLWGNTFFSFNSHGTHVAGTIAANRDGSGMHGVAFGADLSSARLFGDELTVVDLPCLVQNQCSRYGASADNTAFAQMYEQALAQGVRAMNHSWGYTYYAYTPDDVALFHDLLMASPDISATFGHMADASRRSGMIQVVAAGNSGTNPTPASSPQASAPATLPSIFPDIEQYWVSVVNLNDQLTLSDRSMKCGVSAQWCIAAPGSVITSSVLDADLVQGGWVIDGRGNLRFDLDSRQGVPAYADYSGTSMAAPHVTGALGLLFERFPYLSGAQVRDVMLTTATDLGAAGVDDIYGWGLLDLQKAIDGPGQLRVDTEVVMDRRAGGHKVWQGEAWDDWRNDIGGPGRLTKSGEGWLRLSGDNTFAGATVNSGLLELDGDNALTGGVRVQGGTLLLDGRLSGSDLTVAGGLAVVNGSVTGDTRVESGGALGGSGILGDTWVAGTIAPGNSIGTLTIDGDYTQAASATLVAELQPPDLADLLSITGSANLLGGTLVARQLPGTYVLGQQYRVLSAQGGITGTFDTIDTSAISPFLSLSMLYGANSLRFDVVRGTALADAGRTGNQTATAAALDALPVDQGLPVPLTQLDFDSAPTAFDRLSGEAHASARQLLLDGSRMLRDASLARAAAGQDAFLGQRDPDATSGAWVEMHRHGGRIADDGNAARAEHSSSAALVGIDRQFEGGWRAGVLGGTGSTDFDVRGRASEGEVDSRHVGVYGSGFWDGLGLRAGYSHAWHELDLRRDVAFAGFGDGVQARYDATSWQAFVELGYRIGNGRWELEPYLQYAHVELDTDGFTEDGGAAALSGRADSTRVDLATAGLRFDLNLRAGSQQQSWASLRGGLGYRYAGGDQARTAQLSFDGARWYGVRSPVIADEATLVELGLAARTSSNSVLEFGYTGALSSDARDHGASARFSLQF